MWNSKLQTEIALSTTEAEYIALSQSMRELIPARRLLREVVQKLGLMGLVTSQVKSTVFEDNNGAISVARSPKITPRTKHIATKYHFFKSHIGTSSSDILIEKINTEEQTGDIFTKGLPPAQFVYLRKKMCGW